MAERKQKVEEAKVEATAEVKVEREVAPAKEAPVRTEVPVTPRPSALSEQGTAAIEAVNAIFNALEQKQTDPRLDRAFKNVVVRKDMFVGALQTYFLLGGK